MLLKHGVGNGARTCMADEQASHAGERRRHVRQRCARALQPPDDEPGALMPSYRPGCQHPTHAAALDDSQSYAQVAGGNSYRARLQSQDRAPLQVFPQASR